MSTVKMVCWERVPVDAPPSPWAWLPEWLAEQREMGASSPDGVPPWSRERGHQATISSISGSEAASRPCAPVEARINARAVLLSRRCEADCSVEPPVTWADITAFYRRQP